LQVKGAADPINSAFRLTYNMVLNLLRVEEVNPEYMMERSFFQFQNYSNIPKLYKGEFHVSICFVNVILCQMKLKVCSFSTKSN